MGSKYLNATLKVFVGRHFDRARADLFACFIEQAFHLVSPSGLISLVTMHSWMFLPSFEDFRKHLLRTSSVLTMLHLGPRAFESISGEIVQVAAFSAAPLTANAVGRYFRLVEGDGQHKQTLVMNKAHSSTPHFIRSKDDFSHIPGMRLAYWLSKEVVRAFSESFLVSEVAEPKQGMATADNNRFVRFWHEVSFEKIGLRLPDRVVAQRSQKKWFPYNKGGDYRRWYGNSIWVVNWEDDGRELFAFRPRAAIRNPDFYFREGITWTTTGFGQFGVRFTEPGFLFDVKGSSCFCDKTALPLLLGFFSSVLCPQFLNAFNPTSENQVGNIGELPVLRNLFSDQKGDIEEVVQGSIQIAKDDWNSCETSWDFERCSLILSPTTEVCQALEHWKSQCSESISRLQELEERNNRIFIGAYGLQDELSPEVTEDQITLYRPDQEEDIKRLISYTIGCMMGRYSLDKPGLIYAHSGNEAFDPSQYETFPADEDGIIPVTDTAWFDDDAANRLVQFISVAWPEEHLQENLTFIAESLGPKKGESPRDTIRRYLSQGFFKHHMKMYKKRPIYWLFSSGKGKAFECLVYLHRYNEGTLSRMRTEYVIPLQGKIDARIEQLKDDIQAATSTAHGKKLQKEREKLVKQQAELQTFDEKLRHYADKRIALDLDDGVKVNYGKFGDLLAEVKAIHGKKSEE